MMCEFTTVARVGEIPEGSGITVEVNGRSVAVFYDRGEYHAIDGLCPHMGAPLADGQLENGVVACYWHGWRFQICDGTWCDNRRIKIDHFEVRVVDDAIQVRVPPKEQGIPGTNGEPGA
jgi:nitrite reductase (NADH) small subunit/3-phenylpropionate/trans-cinnamate dioxygenase ferredoxin subunit